MKISNRFKYQNVSNNLYDYQLYYECIRMEYAALLEHLFTAHPDDSTTINSVLN